MSRTGLMARRLAAILAADVVGYSRLMAADEAGTHARLKALQTDIIGPLVAELHGRIVKLMGDGALVEFPSVVEAVQCAVEVQRGVAEHQGKLPEDQRIAFRIGVNLGDVIIEGDDIHGDGVNVAARLEALADPGGILISRTVRDHVQDKLPYRFEDLGEQRVKNIPRPVHVFRVVADGATPVSRRRTRLVDSRWLWAVAALVLLLLGAGAAWHWLRPSDTSPAVGEAAQQTALDKYRIAVLPFVNMSADAENEYFSDGMTEELISKLSRLHDLTVIARTSIMQYKETGKSIAEIGRELQVGTILEGSVRKAGDRLRITAQLVDVASQGHLWSQDYDRTLDDVFAIQSDVAQHVAEALQITLKPAETRQIEKAGTDDLEAYNAYLKGLYHYSTWSKEGLEKSIEYFEQAIARDPDFAKAYAAMAFSYDLLADNGHLPPDDAFPKVKEGHAGHWRSMRRPPRPVLTKASARPLLSGLATGVKHGCKPRAQAKSRVSWPCRGCHGRTATRWRVAPQGVPKRLSTAASIRSRIASPTDPGASLAMPADHLAVVGVDHERDRGVLAVPAGDLEDIGAPAQVRADRDDLAIVAPGQVVGRCDVSSSRPWTRHDPEHALWLAVGPAAQRRARGSGAR